MVVVRSVGSGSGNAAGRGGGRDRVVDRASGRGAWRDRVLVGVSRRGGVVRRRGWEGRSSCRVEQAPDAAGEVAFEAADRFAFGFAFGVSAVEVGAGGWVGAGAGERDDVDRAVELAVTAAVEPVAFGVAGAGGDRGGAGVPREARVGREPFGAGGVADDDRGGDRSAAALVEQLRAVSLDQRLELGEERLLLLADLADPLQGRLRDAKLRAAGQLPELAGESRPDAWAFQPGGPDCASSCGAICTRCQRSWLICRTRSWTSWSR